MTFARLGMGGGGPVGNPPDIGGGGRSNLAGSEPGGGI